MEQFVLHVVLNYIFLNIIIHLSFIVNAEITVTNTAACSTVITFHRYKAGMHFHISEVKGVLYLFFFF